MTLLDRYRQQAVLLGDIPDMCDDERVPASARQMLALSRALREYDLAEPQANLHAIAPGVFPPALLFDVTLTGTTASIDTGANAIPPGYNVLEVWVIARTDEVATNGIVDIIVNGDTGANYDRQNITGINTSASANGAAAENAWRLAAHSNSGSASYPGITRLTIPGYSQTTFWKVAEAIGAAPDATVANGQVTFRSFGWRSTAAINQLKLAAESTNNLLAGSRLLIYGR